MSPLLQEPLMYHNRSQRDSKQAQLILLSLYAFYANVMNFKELTICTGCRSRSGICLRIHRGLRLHRQEKTTKLLYCTQEISMEIMDVKGVPCWQILPPPLYCKLNQQPRHGGNIICSLNSHP